MQTVLFENDGEILGKVVLNSIRDLINIHAIALTISPYNFNKIYYIRTYVLLLFLI